MAQVLSFPDADDRQVVLDVIALFLYSNNAVVQECMLRTARKILDKYNVSRIKLPDFIVRAKGDKLSNFEATEIITGETCPGCGAYIYNWPGKVRIVHIINGIKHDLMTYLCSCGRIFTKKEAVHIEDR